MDQLLSQIDESDEHPDQVMAQISEESDKNLVHLGQMLSQLKGEDMDKIVTMLDGMDFAEVDSENQSDMGSQDEMSLAEVYSEDFGDFENEDWFGQIGSEEYDEMFDGVSDMLAEISSEDREKLESLVA